MTLENDLPQWVKVPNGKGFGPVWNAFQMSREPEKSGVNRTRHRAKCNHCGIEILGKSERLERHLQNCNEIPADLKSLFLKKIKKPETETALDFLNSFLIVPLSFLKFFCSVVLLICLDDATS